jgi:hypothetical protein
MPLKAVKWIRKMRGGAQSHLIVAADGRHYVVKFKQNPQHRRVLVNEWVAGILLEQLGLPAPKTDLIEISPEFLAANPEAVIRIGNRVEPVDAGWHFASGVPVDPDRFAIYDYLPDALLRQVANFGDFLGALVFDKWVSNADSRQCVFFRAQLKDWISGAGGGKVAFVALMMDHGFIFGGPHWTLEDSPLYGLYSRPIVYESVIGLESFQPWLDQVVNFPSGALDRVLSRVPEWWLNGDREELERLLERLWRRRRRVPWLVENSKLARVNPFPNWP